MTRCLLYQLILSVFMGINYEINLCETLDMKFPFEELVCLYSGPTALHWHEGALGWLDRDQPWRGSGPINILPLWSWFVILILNYSPSFLTHTNTFLTAKCSSDGLHKTFPPMQTSYLDCVLFVTLDWPSGWYCWSLARATTRAE